MNTEDLCKRAAARVALGPREIEVLEGLLMGDTEAEIAKSLGISPHTVHAHARRLYLKFGVHNRVALFRELLITSG